MSITTPAPRPLRPSSRTAADLRLVFAPSGHLLESSRACEADVFHQWYGNTRAELEDEYAPYDATSLFISLVDGRDEVVGTARFITPGAGYKTLDDLARPPWSVDAERSARAAGMDLANTWDCATMGVRSDVRGGAQTRVSLALFHGVLKALRVNHVQATSGILDERVRRLLSAVGLCYRPLPGATPQPYLGSTASVPVHALVAREIDHQRRTAPDAHRLVTMGVGMDGVSIPADHEFRLTSARTGVGGALQLSRSA